MCGEKEKTVGHILFGFKLRHAILGTEFLKSSNIIDGSISSVSNLFEMIYVGAWYSIGWSASSVISSLPHNNVNL